jgi:hypothetical protein
MVSIHVSLFIVGGQFSDVIQCDPESPNSPSSQLARLQRIDNVLAKVGTTTANDLILDLLVAKTDLRIGDISASHVWTENFKTSSYPIRDHLGRLTRT